MADLVIKFADLASEPIGTGRDVTAEVLVTYTREVPLTDGTVLQPVPMRKQLGPGGTAIFPVTPSDSTSVIEDFRGFGVRVEWLMTHRGERARQAEKRRARTVKVLTADGATVQFGRLLPAEDVGPQYATVGELLGDVTAVYATVDNLTATATALPPGATPTVTVSGPIPNKVINIGVPRGADGAPGQDGMGYEEGQQLLAQNAATLTAAQTAAADADTAATRAENAEGVALAPASEVIADVHSNSTTAAVQRSGVLTPATISHTGVQAALNSAATFGLRVQTAGSYTTDQTLKIAADCDLSGLHIDYTGTGTCVRVGLDTGTLSNTSVRLPTMRHGGKTATGWAQVAGTIGVDLRNLSRCTVTGTETLYFETGWRLIGDGGEHAYNRYDPGHLRNNKINLRFHVQASGYVNDNVFEAGRCSHFSNEAAGGSGAAMTGPAPGTRHIHMTKSAGTWAGANSNKFYGLSLENVGTTEFALDIDEGHKNIFDGCRWETWFGGSAVGANTAPRVRIGAAATENMIRGGYDAHRIQLTYASGASSRGMTVDAPYGARRNFADQPLGGEMGTVGGFVLANISGLTSPVMSVMRPGWEGLGDSPATAWLWRWTGTALEGKTTGAAYAKVRLDGALGQLRLGSGVAEPAAGLVGTTTDLRTITSFNPSQDDAFDSGTSSNRWRDVRASRFVALGSLLLRDNGGVLQVSSDGAATWKTVTLA